MTVARRMVLLSTLQVLASASQAQPRAFPFEHFAADGKKEGVRRFSHSEYLLLPNYTTVEMRFDVDADPDTILPVDVEHKNGVRLVACQPNQLVFHLPASHVPKVKAWRHITASEQLHVCEHQKDRPMYHRVKEVEFTKHPETPKGHTTAVFTTQELTSPSEVLPRINFEYRSTPVEVLPADQQESARQVYEERARALSESQDRRLQTGPDGYGDFTMSKNQLQGYNNFHPVAGGTDERNWRPLSHAKFGWNWNYRTNTVRNPQFKITVPNMRGFVLLKNPFLRFLGGLNVKFQSKWDDINPFQTPPKVNIDASIDGTADINLDVSVMGSASKDSKIDPFGTGTFDILGDNPNFRWARKTYWFDHVPKNWMMGGIPITLIPGIHCGLKMYHNGLFQGSARGGVNTKAKIVARATYDSITGLDFKFKADALNVRLLPPTWMIFTKHFEVGLFFDPTLYIKGHIGPTYGKLLLAAKPRVSASILAAGEQAFGLQQQAITKELVVYPFRAINLPPGESWAIGIQANGRSIMTSTKMSTGLGVVEFHQYVDHFRFGLVDQRDLHKHPIYVILFRQGQFVSGTPVDLFCNEVVEFVCEPAPTKAVFNLAGRVVVVQLTMAWHNDPEGFLESNVRTVSMVFPTFTLDTYTTKRYNDLTTANGGKPPEVQVLIKRLGKEYRAIANVTTNGQFATFVTPRVQALGIQWMDAWRVNYGTIQGQDMLTKALEPTVEVWYKMANGQRTKEATGAIRNIDFAHPHVDNKINERFNLINDAYTATNGYAGGQVYANGEIGFNSHEVKFGSRFIYPGWATAWHVGVERTVYWSTDYGWRLLRNNGKQHFTIAVRDQQTDKIVGANVSGDFSCLPGPLEAPAGVKNFIDYGDECHFQTKVFVGESFANHIINIEVIWIEPDDQKQFLNVLRSPQIEILPKEFTHPTASARKLEIEGKWEDGFVESGTIDGSSGDVAERQLNDFTYGIKRVSSNEDLQQNSQLHPICIKKKLSYRLHLGVDYRVAVTNIQSTGALGGGLQWLNALGHNLLDTGTKPIWQATPINTFLDKILPKGLCQGGVCQGELPGCPGGIIHSKFMGNLQYTNQWKYPATPNPTLELELSRPFTWTKDSKAAAAGALAFGMALMPEFIRIGSLVLTSILPNKKHKVNELGNIYTKGDRIWVGGRECKWFGEPVCKPDFIYRGTEVAGCTMRDNRFQGWCSLERTFAGNWRLCDLACMEPDGASAKTVPDDEVDKIVDQLRKAAKKDEETTRRLSDSDEPVIANRFAISFQPGSLNYELTEDFVRTLIRRQAFRGIEDGREAELGEAKIVGFRVSSGEAGNSSLLPAPTDIETFEFNYTRQKDDPYLFEFKESIKDFKLAEAVASGSYAKHLLVAAGCILALIGAIVVVGCYLWKSRSKPAYSEIIEANME